MSLTWLKACRRRAPCVALAISTTIAGALLLAPSARAIPPVNGQTGVTPSGTTPAASDDKNRPTAPASASNSGAGSLPASAAEDASAAVTYRNLVPSDWIETQGARENDRLLALAAQQDRLLPDSNPQVAAARAILQRLIPFALKWNDRARQWKWDVNIVRSPQVNGIGLPGGKLLIDTALLQRLHLDDDETALLMAHLMAHALREHARARIGEEQMASLNQQKLAGTFSTKGLEDAQVDVGQELLNMQYSADDETEADVIGADIASRAGFDPRAGLQLWTQVGELPRRRGDVLQSTHPVSEKRLRDLKKRQKDMLWLYAKAIGKTPATLPPYRRGPLLGAKRAR